MNVDLLKMARQPAKHSARHQDNWILLAVPDEGGGIQVEIRSDSKTVVDLATGKATERERQVVQVGAFSVNCTTGGPTKLIRGGGIMIGLCTFSVNKVRKLIRGRKRRSVKDLEDVGSVMWKDVQGICGFGVEAVGQSGEVRVCGWRYLPTRLDGVR